MSQIYSKGIEGCFDLLSQRVYTGMSSVLIYIYILLIYIIDN
mgnify:FL=1